MGKHIHRLSDKDFETKTAVCANCGPVKLVTYGNTYRCYVAYREQQNLIKGQRRAGEGKYWTEQKKDTCERCGFVAEDPCQMDLDHRDGDRTNHEPENAQTLCANCHRLKSFRSHLF